MTVAKAGDWDPLDEREKRISKKGKNIPTDDTLEIVQKEREKSLQVLRE